MSANCFDGEQSARSGKEDSLLEDIGKRGISGKNQRDNGEIFNCNPHSATPHVINSATANGWHLPIRRQADRFSTCMPGSGKLTILYIFETNQCRVTKAKPTVSKGATFASFASIYRKPLLTQRP